MNIFFLSQTNNLDEKLQQALKNEIEKRGNRIAYISSTPQTDDRPYYFSVINDFKELSSNIEIDYFDLSENFSDKKLEELLEYGTIFLSGGNTFVFMDSANKRNIYQILKKHLENNGLLVGQSAGSIMMTPSIDLAEYGDENSINLQNTNGFGFVDFEFHPHYSHSLEEQVYLSEYRKKKGVPVYVCEDGGGIFVSDGKVALFGPTFIFNIQ